MAMPIRCVISKTIDIHTLKRTFDVYFAKENPLNEDKLIDYALCKGIATYNSMQVRSSAPS